MTTDTDAAPVTAAELRSIARGLYDTGWVGKAEDIRKAADFIDAQDAALAAVRAECERLRHAVRAAIAHGSHGDTDEGISVSYLLEEAVNWRGDS